VKICFTDDEYAVIAARAAEARVSVQRYLVDGALARRSSRSVPSALAAEVSSLRRLTAGLASNINQIARRLNAGAEPDAGVLAAADAVRRAMSRLDSALAWLGAPPTGNSAPDPRNEHPARGAAHPHCGAARPHPGAMHRP
jgi:hypothetical protein